MDARHWDDTRDQTCHQASDVIQAVIVEKDSPRFSRKKALEPASKIFGVLIKFKGCDAIRFVFAISQKSIELEIRCPQSMEPEGINDGVFTPVEDVFAVRTLCRNECFAHGSLAPCPILIRFKRNWDIFWILSSRARTRIETSTPNSRRRAV